MFMPDMLSGKPWHFPHRDMNPGSIQCGPPGAQDCYKDNPVTPNLTEHVLSLRRGGLHFVAIDQEMSSRYVRWGGLLDDRFSLKYPAVIE